MRRALPSLALLATLLAASGCGSSGSSSAGSLPLVHVADLPLPGDTTRFDYQSLDPQLNRLFIAHLGDGALTVVNTDSQRVADRVEGIAEAHGVATAPELGRVFVSATGSNEVVAVDERTGEVAFRAPTGEFPDGVAYAPDPMRVFVSDKVGGTVTVFDARNGKSVGTIDLGGEVGNVQYDTDTGMIFANAQGLGQLVSIDPETLEIVDRIELGGCEGNHGLLIDADSRLAFVACEANAALLTVDLTQMEVAATNSVGDGPDVLAFDPGLSRLYVAAESGVVSVFEIRDGATEKLGEAKLADSAHTVAVDPDTHRVYFPLEDVDGGPVLRVMEPG